MVLPEEVLLKDPSVDKPKKKTFKERCNYIRENITLEPILTCYVVPGVLARLATQNLNLDKACRVNLKYGDSVCDALLKREGSKYLKEEKVVQELISALEGWKNLLLTAVPSLLILFLGAWSDRTGKRKICILLPIIGDLLSCLSNILNAYYFYELPVQLTMFFEGFFPAITGGWVSTYMGAFSYISDISSKESRTFRLGVANLCLSAGNPIGSALSGILLDKIGYYGVFTVSSILYIFSICYGFFYIKDPKRVLEKEDDKISSFNLWAFLKTFFDLRHVKDTMTVAFKSGPNKRRTKSILVLAAIAFVYGPSYGEFTVRYLFTRYRFNWDALKYSFYNTFYVCIHSIGAIVSISFFSRHMKWDDSVLAFISSLSKLLGGLVTAFARNSFQMYLAVVIETFNATSYTALRSISSKLVTSDELGKMASIFNLMEILTSMVFGPIYSWIYMVTLEINVSIIYYVSTVLTIPTLTFFVWFFIQHRKSLPSIKKTQTKPFYTENGKSDEKYDYKPVAANLKKDHIFCSIDLIDEKIFLE